MLYVEAKNLELRGISNKTSKTGTVYYVLNLETQDGEAHTMYCPDFNALPQGLKKGDKVTVTLEVSYYKGNPKLTVTKLVKAL